MSAVKILLEASGLSRGVGRWAPDNSASLERYLLSKFIVANLASALVLMAASSVLAATEPTDTPTSPPTASPPPAADQAAQSPSPTSKPATTQVAKKKPSPDDVICKPDVGTGSRVGGVKICLTRAQWREREN